MTVNDQLKSTATIPLHVLRDKIRQIEERIEKLKEERKHIEWVIENCAPPVDLRIDESTGLRLSRHQEQMEKKLLILSILKEKGSAMRSSEIYAALSRSGIEMKKETFDWLMHSMTNDNTIPIVRPRLGQYEYSLN